MSAGRADGPKAVIRPIVVGHGFGALIAYQSLSQALINDLALDRKKKVIAADGSVSCASAPGVPPLWPDCTFLINPAFEASRFEAQHNAAAAVVPPCPQRLKLVVVTADNDFATGTALSCIPFVCLLAGGIRHDFVVHQLYEQFTRHRCVDKGAEHEVIQRPRQLR